MMMSSILLGDSVVVVVVVVLLGPGTTATGARARTMGRAKADNTMPGIQLIYQNHCMLNVVANYPWSL